MSTFASTDARVESCESDADLDIVREIDKFLEDYTSDGAELRKNNNNIDKFDYNPFKKFDAADLDKDNRTSLNNNDVEFVGKNSAIFNLLEDNEEYGIYEHIPNECNWNVFYKTLPPGEPNYSIKQEPENDGFTSNDGMKNLGLSSENFQNSSIQPKIKLEPCSTVSEQNQEDTLLEEMPCTTFLNDDQNELENFSFLQQLNNIQEDISPNENSYEQFTNTSMPSDRINSKTAVDYFSFSFSEFNNIQNPVDSQCTEVQTLNNSKNESKNKIGKWKQNKKYNTDFGNKSSVCKNSKTENEKYQRNKKKSNSNWRKNSFKKNLKNTYQFNHTDYFASSLPHNDINNSMFSSSSPPIHSKLDFNQSNFNDLEHTTTKMLGKNQFHKMPYSKSKKKGFKNSNFAIDKSVCNKFRTPYKPFVQTNHDPPAGNIHKPQKSLNSFYLNRQLENKQHPYLLYHENIQNLDLKNSNPLPMQQDSFHISNQKYSEICPENKEKVISNSPENKDDVNFELHHVIVDYLCPASLVGSTIKFTSRKLANTFIRDKLNMALSSYGTIESSWWTPDDLFFTTYTSRKSAQHVFKIYPKNPNSSY